LKQEYDSNLELGEWCSFALLSVKEGGLFVNYRVAHGSVGWLVVRASTEKKLSKIVDRILLIEKLMRILIPRERHAPKR
jgi:hypothetical protein